VNKISVVIPALNEEKYLPRLLQSLAEQTRRDFEVVVVDGSSQDKTVEVARSFGAKLPGLSVLVSPKRSVPLQRNLGARATRGEWLVFLDADSQVQPYFMERIEAFIKETQPKLFTSWFRPDSDGASDAVFALIANMFVEGSKMVHRSMAPGPLTVVRRDTFELVDGYDEALTFGEDYDLTERLTARGIELRILRETLYVLSLRRVRKDGKLRTIGFYGYAGMQVLLTKRNLMNVPFYVMGGQNYEEPIGRSKPRRNARKPAQW
jgi:glycosyltransferase involved in cell wall biosynthesis